MSASWPLTLPQMFNVSGNSEQLGDGRLRSQTDTGPGKMRRRSSSTARQMAIGFNASDAQLETFIGFINSDLAGGTLAFTIPATHGGGTKLVRIGASMPSWSNLAPDLWTISMTIEVLQ